MTEENYDEVIYVGPKVVCDICNADFTTAAVTGGFIFESKAVCPVCAPDFEAEVKRLGEAEFIRARCPEGMTFGDWVRALRGGNHTVQIRTFDSLADFLRGCRGDRSNPPTREEATDGQAER